MGYRLPPMNAVKAFEAVARWGSMVRASEELGVSPSAVSHQIRSLEDWFDRSLFEREGRDLRLTDTGHKLFDLVKPAFGQLRVAMDRLFEPPAGRLKVLVCPSLGSIWLAPRLEDFAREHPDIDVELHCRLETVDLVETEFDCAIRYCAGVPGRHVGDLLMRESVFPVCAPELLEGPPGLKTLDDLKQHTLLHDVLGGSGVVACDWSSWFAEIGMPHLASTRGHGFSDSNIMYEAACRGAGVALGRSVLVAPYVAAGRLVLPFNIVRQSTHSWYFVSTPAKLSKSPLSAFRQWLLAEAVEAVN